MKEEGSLTDSFEEPHPTVTKKPNGGRSVPRRELSDIQRVTEDMPDPRKRKTTSQFGHDDVKVEQKKAKVIRVPTNTDSVVYEILDSTVEEEDMDEEKAVPVVHLNDTELVNRLLLLTEQNTTIQVKCAILTTKLESKEEENVALKLQFEYWKDKFGRKTDKLALLRQEYELLKTGTSPIPTTAPITTTGQLTLKNLRPLYLAVDATPLDARIANLIYWNLDNQLVVPVRGLYRLGDLLPLFTDRDQTEYEPGLLDAMLFLDSNCTLFVPNTPNQLECYMFDQQSTATLFNERNIRQNLVTLDILQYCFQSADKLVYAPECLTSDEMISLLSSISPLELLPFQPCHLSMVFSIPTREKTANAMGSKKSCTTCNGSTAVLEHPKKGDPAGKKLRTHIPKRCPLALLSRTQEQIAGYTLKTQSLFKEINDQLNELDVVYRDFIQASHAARYNYFYGLTRLQAPISFTSCLIDSEGLTYQHARIQQAIEAIVRAPSTDFQLALTSYGIQHTADIAHMTRMINGLATKDALQQRVFILPQQPSGVLVYPKSVAHMMAQEGVNPFPPVQIRQPEPLFLNNFQPQVEPQQQLNNQPFLFNDWSVGQTDVNNNTNTNTEEYPFPFFNSSS